MRSFTLRSLKPFGGLKSFSSPIINLSTGKYKLLGTSLFETSTFSVSIGSLFLNDNAGPITNRTFARVPSFHASLVLWTKLPKLISPFAALRGQNQWSVKVLSTARHSFRLWYQNKAGVETAWKISQNRSQDGSNIEPDVSVEKAEHHQGLLWSERRQMMGSVAHC